MSSYHGKESIFKHITASHPTQLQNSKVNWHNWTYLSPSRGWIPIALSKQNKEMEQCKAYLSSLPLLVLVSVPSTQSLTAVQHKSPSKTF